MESTLTQRRTSLEEKIPDIKKTLDMVEFLQERRVGVGLQGLDCLLDIVQQSKRDSEEDLNDLETEGSTTRPLKTTFELNDTLYAEAELEDCNTVYLWLGVRLHDLYIFKLGPKTTSTGKCYAVLRNLCRDHFATIEISSCSDKSEQYYRRPRVLAGASHDYGGQYSSGI
jgi:hypothetical protein